MKLITRIEDIASFIAHNQHDQWYNEGDGTFAMCEQKLCSTQKGAVKYC